MNRESALPLYVQVAETIQSRIRKQEFRIGELIPSARELATEFGVSNITIRKAVSLLTDEGMLTTRQGQGTRVARADLDRVEILMSGQFRDWLDSASGRSPRLKVTVLEQALVRAPRAVGSQLGCEPDEDVHFVRRTRAHRGRTISYFLNYYRRSVCGRLPRAEIRRRSFVETFQDAAHVSLERMVQRVEASAADLDLSRILDIEFGAPLFFIENAYYAGEARPVLISHMYYRGDSYVYRAEIPLYP